MLLWESAATKGMAPDTNTGATAKSNVRWRCELLCRGRHSRCEVQMWADGKTPRTSRRFIGWLLWPALLLIASAPVSASGAADPPQALFKDLFIAVQSAQIYADG